MAAQAAPVQRRAHVGTQRPGHQPLTWTHASSEAMPARATPDGWSGVAGTKAQRGGAAAAGAPTAPGQRPTHPAPRQGLGAPCGVMVWRGRAPGRRLLMDSKAVDDPSAPELEACLATVQ